MRAVEEFLASIGVPRGSFRMVRRLGDEPRATASAPRPLTTLLRHMFFHPAGTEFAQSMPYGGEDNGSWKKRLAGASLPRQRLRQDRHPQRRLRPLRLRQGGLRQDLRLLDPLQPARSAADARQAQDRIVMALIDNG